MESQNPQSEFIALDSRLRLAGMTAFGENCFIICLICVISSDFFAFIRLIRFIRCESPPRRL